jgi:hypothetical protein
VLVTLTAAFAVPPTWAFMLTLVCDNPIEGAAMIVIVAWPVLPSAVAVIVVVPALKAVTIPVPDTFAFVVSPLVQTTCLPVSALPETSRAIAESLTESPTVRVAVSGETTSEAIGITVTVISSFPLLSAVVAVIVTGPAALADTTPALTVATASLLLVQVKLLSESALPEASHAEADNCAVLPSSSEVGPETVTEATAGSSGGPTGPSPPQPAISSDDPTINTANRVSMEARRRDADMFRSIRSA